MSVRNIPVEELIFALSRDAKLNIDLHPGISGNVTINAIDQTLQQILTRIARQVDMRWEMDGPNLAVMPDSPFLRTYRIDYVNMTRDVKVTTEVSSQVASTGTGGNPSGGATLTRIESGAKNRFWETLDKNIKDILRETDKLLPEGSSETIVERNETQSAAGAGSLASLAAKAVAGATKVSTTPGSVSPTSVNTQNDGTTSFRRSTFREAASVITHPESGVVTVRATARQHEKVQEFVDQIMTSSRRQVLIEATIAEVTLSQSYQQGVDWQRLRRDSTGLSLTQTAPGVLTAATGSTASATASAGPLLSAVTQTPAGTLPGAISGSLFVLGYRNSPANPVSFAAAIKLLDSYGNVKVLSSPKLSVMNNQTALLKVVNNIVFFNVKADTTTSNGIAQTNVTTTPQSVSVGLVMSVTPQISESESVVLNVRPMISRVTSYKSDPNPNIPTGLSNLVPEIETREMESVMRIGNGDIAVLGGLMQDSINYKDDGIPLLSRLPGVGSLFSYKNETNAKTELVIFLRPIVVREASLEGDYRNYETSLPNRRYLERSWERAPLNTSSTQ